MGKVKVMIVDDLKMARELFELYLRSSENYEVVRSLSTAARAEDYAQAEHVDLVIMDILTNDETNGLEASARIKAKCPNTKIVAVTSMVEASWMKRAREIGIDSFWYKEAAEDVILDVLDRTMAGESVYPDSPPKVQLGLIDSTDLSGREMEVLRLMTTGMSNARIADRLGVAENTVKKHIQHMLEKTGCGNRTELAIKARVSGVAVNID